MLDSKCIVLFNFWTQIPSGTSTIQSKTLAIIAAMPSSSPRHPAYSSYRINYRNNQSPSNRLDSDGALDMDEVAIDRPILAVNLKGKFLGGAFWKAEDSTLILLGDIQCANPADMLDLGS
jgi:hypothetical protein